MDWDKICDDMHQEFVESSSIKITADWEQVRIQAAIAAMQGILSNPEHRLDYDNGEGDNALPAIAIVSVKCADALVEELKN